MQNLRSLLLTAQRRNTLPTIIAFNRIDGPGSSLDLREFQQTFWSMPEIPEDLTSDESMIWSRGLPRTIGITINTGTKIQAIPFDEDRISVQSIEYGTEASAKCGEVLPIKQNWLLRILDLFGLRGVKFVLHNLRPGIQSSGLGGSASATTGVCILANELTDQPFNNLALISMASRIEQEYGVSLTGTQEQSNVIFGGVCDYLWFPWGVPRHDFSSFGSSIRTELVSSNYYTELERRIAIYHTGITRASVDVNNVWIDGLSKIDEFRSHREKLEIAYRYREGLRLMDWQEVSESIRDYQRIRTQLCPSYMDGAREIWGFAHDKNCVVFPLGAGGGGGVLVFSEDPGSLTAFKGEIEETYREIPIKIQSQGHKIINLPFTEEI